MGAQLTAKRRGQHSRLKIDADRAEGSDAVRHSAAAGLANADNEGTEVRQRSSPRDVASIERWVAWLKGRESLRGKEARLAWRGRFGCVYVNGYGRQALAASDRPEVTGLGRPLPPPSTAAELSRRRCSWHSHTPAQSRAKELQRGQLARKLLRRRARARDAESGGQRRKGEGREARYLPSMARVAESGDRV